MVPKKDTPTDPTSPRWVCFFGPLESCTLGPARRVAVVQEPGHLQPASRERFPNQLQGRPLQGISVRPQGREERETALRGEGDVDRQFDTLWSGSLPIP